MSSDEPIVLSVGTEVSAKYKGAFCEAKIKKVCRVVRCKVTVKSDSNIITIDESDIVSGTLKNGHSIVVKHFNSISHSNNSEVIVNKIFDQSLYTVVFDDGDEATLKRTSLCLKSGKHFAESDTLDQLPLTHPEHFSSPVLLGRRCRRKQNHINSALQSRRKKNTKVAKRAKNQLDVGKIVRVEYGDKRGSKNKDSWFPAVIVSVKYDDDGIFYKVRSFCDDRFYDVRKTDACVIDKSTVLSNSHEDISIELEDALQKTITYLDTGKFPDNWDNFYSEDADDSSDNEETKPDNNKKSSEDDDDDDEEEMYEESESEEDSDSNRDAFLCGLYSFFVDSKLSQNISTDFGTVNGKEIDLYRLYRTVNYLGGYNRINNRKDWKKVYNKLAFGKMYVDPKELANNIDKDVTSQYNHLRLIYKKYLHAFHELHRKLGTDPVRDSSGWPKSRTSRGERKERTRLNSVSSTSSFVAPASSSRRSNSKQATIKTEQVNDVIPVSSNTASTTKQPKEKIEDKKRKKNKNKVNEPSRVKSESENDDSLLTNSSMFDGFSDDDIDSNLAVKDSNINPKDISYGDCLSVLYGKGKQTKLYDAKVVKIRVVGGTYQFFVHYCGWSPRYDEWVELHRINKIIKDKSPRRRSGKVKNKGEPLPESVLSNQKSSDKEEKVEPTRSRKSSIKSESGKSIKKQQLATEETPRRSRTSSFTKKDNAKTEEKTSTITTSTTSKRLSKQDNTSVSKTKTSKSKKVSESDEDSQNTRSSLKSEKRKDTQEKQSEAKKAKNSTKEHGSKRKIERNDSSASLKIKQEETQEVKVETDQIESNTTETENVEVVDSSNTTDIYNSDNKTNSPTITTITTTNNQSETVVDLDDSDTETKLTHPVVLPETPKTSTIVESSSISVQSDSLITDNTELSLQSSSEDLEVQKILAGNETSSEQTDAKSTSSLEVVKIKITPEDIDLDRSSPGQLIVAEDEEDENEVLESEEEQKTIKDQNEDASVKMATQTPTKIEEEPPEDTKDNLVVLDEPTKETNAEPPASRDFPSLLCEETVPASPPSSPLSSPSPQYHPHTLVIDTDQSISSSVSSTFCADIAPVSLVSSTSNNIAKIEPVMPTCSSLSQHQPFSSLIAAASQQSMAIQSNKFSNLDKSFAEPTSVITQSIKNTNLLDLKKNSDLNVDDNMDDDNDDDEDDEDVDDDDEDDDDDDDDIDLEDEQVDGVEADVDEFDDDHFYNEKERTNFRKIKIVDRKRRTSRKGSKCTSNLSSQDSSQDGDENNFEDNFNKISECTSFIKHTQSSNAHKDDDDSGDSPSHADKRPSMSPAPSPKKRRRGRIRTISQSESRDSSTKERTASFKSRGRYRHFSGHSHTDLSTPTNQTYSPRTSETLHVRSSQDTFSVTPDYFHPISPTTNVSVTRKYPYPEPQEPDCSILYTYKSKKDLPNFLTPFPNDFSLDEKCEELMHRLHKIQSLYNEVRTEHMALDRKRKRSMQKSKEKKEKQDDQIEKSTINDIENNSTAINTTNNSLTSGATNSGSESSSSKNDRNNRSRRELKTSKENININDDKDSDNDNLLSTEIIKDVD